MIVKEGALLYQGVGGPMVPPIYLPIRTERKRKCSMFLTRQQQTNDK
jgi:hypothetical protein